MSGHIGTTKLQSDEALSALLACDRELFAIGSRIKVLKTIDWPAELEARFLQQWQRGEPTLPEPPVRRPELTDEMTALKAIMARLDRGHPVGNWLFKTAWSYFIAAQMLMNVGSREFTRCSTALYGRPDTRYRSQEFTAVDAAQDVLAITDDLVGRERIPVIVADIPADVFAQRLRDRLGSFFDRDKVDVVLDPHLSSKATAGSKHINLRSTAMFSELDLDQLLQHEAFVHTATLLNGKHQPSLKSLGLGAPRTTRVQEGLATFSEIITGSLDLNRLRRIALRVIMLKRGLDGADFIEVFRGFLDAGQTPVESYRSASRLFRGGNVRGHVCFTKDGAYLEGVMLVHIFIRKVLQEHRAELLPMLFAGRVTTADVITLAPWLESGLIARAVYVPPWARDPQRVLSLMAFFTASQRFTLSKVTLENFVAYENELVDETMGVP